MKHEKSCGAVVFTQENGTVRYVITESIRHFFGFPKGHVEPGESEEETALREVQEETGLSVRLFDGFRMEDKYTFEIEGETICKKTVYFLGEYVDQTPKRQESEIREILLLDYETALARLKFDRQKEILKAAHERILLKYISI